jgi:hypothetical protein
MLQGTTPVDRQIGGALCFEAVVELQATKQKIVSRLHKFKHPI